MPSEIKLQALKEGVDTVEVNAVKVAPGDTVAKDQPLLEVQAEKAALDVASPVAGRVAKVLVNVGDEIKVGQPYLVIEESAGAAKPEAKDAKESKPARPAAEAPKEQAEPTPRETAAVAKAAPPGGDGNGRRAPA